MSRLGVRGALTAAFLLASAAPMIVFWLWPHSAVLTQEMADARDRHLLHARNIGAALERYERDVLGVFSSFAPLVARGTSFEFARGLLHDLPLQAVPLGLELFLLLIELGDQLVVRFDLVVRTQVAQQFRAVLLRTLERCEDGRPAGVVLRR